MRNFTEFRYLISAEKKNKKNPENSAEIPLKTFPGPLVLNICEVGPCGFVFFISCCPRKQYGIACTK